MRDFLRGCLVWLFGYPLSVVVATTVLTAPVWVMSYFPFDESVRMVLGAAHVAGFFALVPALMTPRSPYVWPYVAAGTRTGAWCGLLTMSMFIIALVCCRGHRIPGIGERSWCRRRGTCHVADSVGLDRWCGCGIRGGWGCRRIRFRACGCRTRGTRGTSVPKLSLI